MDEVVVAEKRLRRALTRLARILRSESHVVAAEVVDEFMCSSWSKSAVLEFEERLGLLWVDLGRAPMGPKTVSAAALCESMFALNVGFGASWRVVSLDEATRLSLELARFLGEVELENELAQNDYTTTGPEGAGEECPIKGAGAN